MMKFTLLAAIFSTAAVCAQPQAHFGRDAFKKVKKELSAHRVAGKSCPGLALKSVRSSNPNAAIFKPLHEKEYAYTGTEWELQGDYTYTYDTKGNILTSEFVGVEGELLKYVYEYNENNKQISSIESQAMPGEELAYSLKHLKKYDEQVPDLVIESAQYGWNDEWVLLSNGYTWKRNITRNSKGYVKGVHMTTYFSGNYEDHHRTTINHNLNGEAVSWKYEEVGYSSQGQPQLEEWYTLKNMQWECSDGQIVTADLSGFFTGNNKLKAAKVVEPQAGETGSIEASYEENGNYTYAFHYRASSDGKKPAGKDVFTHRLLDANGSFEDVTTYYEDMDGNGVASEEEVMEMEKLTVMYDDHGNVVSEAIAMGEGELIGGAQYHYTYNEHGYPVESVFEELNPETMAYEPFIKIVASDFKDVATGIQPVVDSSANVPTRIYDLNGVLRGHALQSLPKGIYILKQGNRTVKVLK